MKQDKAILLLLVCECPVISSSLCFQILWFYQHLLFLETNSTTSKSDSMIVAEIAIFFLFLPIFHFPDKETESRAVKSHTQGHEIGIRPRSQKQDSNPEMSGYKAWLQVFPFLFLFQKWEAHHWTVLTKCHSSPRAPNFWIPCFTSTSFW